MHIQCKRRQAMAGRPNSGKNLRAMPIMLAEQQISQLKERAYQEKRSVSELVRDAIRECYQIADADEVGAGAV
jgi:hypothetical protein